MILVNNLICGFNLPYFMPQCKKIMQQKPKLLDQVRAVARARHLSHKTEDTYHNFIKRYILFHNKRHPNEMGAEEITEFLTHLAVTNKVSSSFTKISQTTPTIYHGNFGSR